MKDKRALEAIANRELADADLEAEAGDVGAAAKRLRDLKAYLKHKAEFEEEEAQDDAVLSREELRARLEQAFHPFASRPEPGQADGIAGQ